MKKKLSYLIFVCALQTISASDQKLTKLAQAAAIPRVLASGTFKPGKLDIKFHDLDGRIVQINDTHSPDKTTTTIQVPCRLPLGNIYFQSLAFAAYKEALPCVMQKVDSSSNAEGSFTIDNQNTVALEASSHDAKLAKEKTAKEHLLFTQKERTTLAQHESQRRILAEGTYFTGAYFTGKYAEYPKRIEVDFLDILTHRVSITHTYHEEAAITSIELAKLPDIFAAKRIQSTALDAYAEILPIVLKLVPLRVNTKKVRFNVDDKNKVSYQDVTTEKENAKK